MKRKQLLQSAAKRLGVTVLAAAMILGYVPANVSAEEVPVEAAEEISDVVEEDADVETAEEDAEVVAEEEDIVIEATGVSSLSSGMPVIEDPNYSYRYQYADTAQFSVTTTEAVIDAEESHSLSLDDSMMPGAGFLPALKDGYEACVEYMVYFNVVGKAEGDKVSCTINLPVPVGYTGVGAKYMVATYDIDTDTDVWSEYIAVANGNASSITIKVDLPVKVYDGSTYINFMPYGVFKKSGTGGSGDTVQDDTPVTDPAQVEIPQGPTTYQSKEGADGLIFRLYNVALARDPEKEGYDSWSNSVTSKSQTAADVAHAFFFSTEFKSKEYTDEQYVKMLYETLCGREPDSDGFTYWVKQLRNGVSREYVYKGFAESAEFTKICEGYKIERGNVELTSARDQNPKTANFMSRFYTKVLDRKFDEKGIEYWCDVYVNQGTSIDDIAAGFINSPEFKSKELTNEAYITMLYDVFLGRTPDDEGYNYWLKQLQDGQSRESVLYCFTGSKEFGTLKASFGL